MTRASKLVFIPLSALLLMAASPSWTTKQVAQWTEADAKQFLASSPWVGKTTPVLLPLRSEAAHRDGGVMGAGQAGGGFGGVNPAAILGLGSSQPTRHTRRPSLTEPLAIRWESAAPVRAAETKAQEQDAPDVESGVYAIAVYDVPGLDANQRTLPRDLKKDAFLKSEGKKDRRPLRVDVLPQDNGLTTVVYIFPRTDQITVEEKRVTFTALVGRLSLAQYFDIEQMKIQGKLEL